MGACFPETDTAVSGVTPAPLLRSRLNDRLGRAARYPVTLIVAPAGFGKTTALRHYIATARLDVVRYDVRDGEHTLAAFARGLAAALESVAPGASATFSAAQQRVLASAHPARELADVFDEHLRRTVCTIAIDDLHHAMADERTAELLVALIERTMGRINWILATRSDAGIPVATWLAYGKMDLPIGEDDLRFTTEEALAAVDDDTVDPAEVEALRELTGGWAVALTIAVRSRTNAADLRSAASGTREMIYRYLAEQVFARLERLQQRFLIESSVLVAFDGELAAALGVGGDFLEQLQRDVAFLGEAGPDSYRYHDLFREFLLRELRRSGAAAWFAAFHNAIVLLEARGRDADALALAVRARDAESLLRIVERAGFALYEQGEAELLESALETLPDSTRASSAAALGLRAVLEADHGRFAQAEPAFAAAIAAAGDEQLRATIVHRFALELVRNERDCLALLAPYAELSSLTPRLQVAILATLATGYVRAGDVTKAKVTIRRALDAVEALGDDVRVRIYQQAAYVYHIAGVHDRARELANLAAQRAAALRLYEVAARAYSVLYAETVSDDVGANLQVLDKFRECARKASSWQTRLFTTLAAYEIEADRGDEEMLGRLDDELAASPSDSSLVRLQMLLPPQALRAAWSGDFRRAYDLLAGTAEAETTPGRRALRAAETALYAFAAGLVDAGEASLRTAVAAVGEEEVPRRAVRTRLLLALCELLRSHGPAAHRHLTDAEKLMTAAMPRLRTLAHAVRSLYRVQGGHAEPAVVAAALERMRAAHFGGMARLLAAIEWPAQREGAPLTTTEREILELLLTGASTKEIAARTSRSPQTVDTHIRSICRKLRCSGRREAVALAIKSGWFA